jgi:hypothetical protein
MSHHDIANLINLYPASFGETCKEYLLHLRSSAMLRRKLRTIANEEISNDADAENEPFPLIKENWKDLIESVIFQSLRYP